MEANVSTLLAQLQLAYKAGNLYGTPIDRDTIGYVISLLDPTAVPPQFGALMEQVRREASASISVKPVTCDVPEASMYDFSGAATYEELSVIDSNDRDVAEDFVAAAQCTCRSILHGHEAGCPYAEGK